MSSPSREPAPITDLPDQTEVAIVGAGPAGLTVALALAAKGVDHVIVDKSAAHNGRSRAATVMPLSLEVLEEFKIVDDLIAHGLKLDGFAGWDRTRRLGRFPFNDLPTKYPYVLVIPQSITEEILESGLTSYGGKVHRHLELTDLSQDDAAATLTFQDGRALRARYVVGADGGHSKVREKAGIEFAGSSYPVSVVLADVDVVLDPDRAQFAAERDEDRVRGFLTPDGTMAVVPLPSGRWRVAAPVVDAVEKPGLDDIRALLHARGPGSIPGEVVGLDWASHFRVHRRHASHYRVGRVLLAGDAAHVHSPVAGQGMNVGIQDGASLGRKLAAVLGGADPGLLDQYAAERQEIAEKVITTTDRLTRSLLIHSRLACAIRNTLLRIGLASSRAQRRMAFVNSQLVYRGK